MQVFDEFGVSCELKYPGLLDTGVNMNKHLCY